MAGFFGRAGIELRDTLTANLEALPARIRAAAEAAVLAGGEVIRAAAYDNANVSPGVVGNGVGGEHMRDEIKVVMGERTHEIFAFIRIDMSIIPYAAHQEFGDRGNGFMRRAVDENRQEVHAVMGEVMKAALGGESVPLSTLVRFRRIA